MKQTDQAVERAAETLQRYNPEKMQEAFTALGAACAAAAKALVEMVQAAVNVYSSMFVGTMRDTLICYAAYNWARVEHPEWVGILNRTKKRRTWKKYHDRILRAYREAVNHGADKTTN